MLLNFCTDYQEDKGRLQAEVEEKNAEIGRQWKELEKLRVRNISKKILLMHELWTDLLTTIYRRTMEDYNWKKKILKLDSREN